MLALPQPLNGLFAGGVCRQMKSADALDSDDAAGAENAGGLGDGGVGFIGKEPALAVRQRKRRPALRTGKRLSMKTPVGLVVVLALAARTHRKAVHRRIGAVVRDAFNKGIAGAALRTGDKGVAIAKIGRLEQFAQALRTNGRIGGDLTHRRPFRSAGKNLKGRFVFQRRTGCCAPSFDLHQRRPVGTPARLFEQVQQGLQVVRPALHFEHQTPAVIENKAAQVQVPGFAIKKRTGPNPLHRAFNLNLQPLEQTKPPMKNRRLLCKKGKRRFFAIKKTGRPRKNSFCSAVIVR